MKYKKLLRHKIEQYQATHEHVTLGLIAAQLAIEPSYLSRFLGDTQTHFSDELLYRLASQIGMSETDVDALLLLRDYDRATHPARKKYLELKIRSESLR